MNRRADLPLASPATRNYARERGVDLSRLSRELGRGFLTRDDVDGSLRPGPGRPERSPWDLDHARFGPAEPVRVSTFSQRAAANLAATHLHVPAVTHHDAADLTACEALRVELRPEAEARSVRLTPLAFHVKALACLLEDFPRFNAALSADGATLWLKRYVAIGIAIDAPYGLVVPVLREANRKKLWTLAQELAELAALARTRKLRPDHFGGASVTISNLGGVGGRGFTPIINPPEIAILGISRARQEPVWDGAAFQPRLMCPLDLTYDHRVINGAAAAAFMSRHAALIADPRRMLI